MAFLANVLRYSLCDYALPLAISVRLTIERELKLPEGCVDAHLMLKRGGVFCEA